MPARTKHPDAKEGEAGTGVVVSPLAVGHAGTIAITGAPADADVTFTVAPPGGGVSEQTVRTDENGRAEIEIVPDTVGELNVAVTQTTITSLGAATAEVEVGAPPLPALAITGLDPPDSDAGPPQRFTLLINGDGFDINTRASFGVFSDEEAEAGLGEAGAPKWEMATRYVDPTQLALDISGGQFPNPDPAIPVSVGKPDGTTAGPVTFAFNPVDEEVPSG